MRSMAIKINVSRNDQEAINDLLEKRGYKRQRRKHHCTLGFIDKMIPDEEAVSVGDALSAALQKQIKIQKPYFEIEGVRFLFKHVIAFVPTEPSYTILTEMNAWLFDEVKRLSKGDFELNQSTIAESYKPHMTLHRTRHLDSRFDKLDELTKSHQSFPLKEAAFVIL